MNTRCNFLFVGLCMISIGLNTQCADRFDGFPIHRACWGGKTPLVQIHMTHPRFDPDLRDNEGDTLLMVASGSVADLIISAKATIDFQNDKKAGRTALMCAALSGDSKKMRLLIEARANINLQDNNGNTALHFIPEQEGPVQGLEEE